jgi:hypothetical protein
MAHSIATTSNFCLVLPNMLRGITLKQNGFLVTELTEHTDSMLNFNHVNALHCTLGHGPRYNIP